MASEVLVKNHFILLYVTPLGLYVHYQLCLGISQRFDDRLLRRRLGPVTLLALDDRFEVTGAEQAVTHTELKGCLCLLLPTSLCCRKNRRKLVPDIAGIKHIDLIYKRIYRTGVAKILPYFVTKSIKFNRGIPAMVSCNISEHRLHVFN